MRTVSLPTALLAAVLIAVIVSVATIGVYTSIAVPAPARIVYVIVEVPYASALPNADTAPYEFLTPEDLAMLFTDTPNFERHSRREHRLTARKIIEDPL